MLMETAHADHGPRRLVVREFGPALVASTAVGGLFGVGLLGLADFAAMLGALWRPLLTILAIMVIAAGAQRVGLLDRLAGSVVPLAQGSSSRLFLLVFALAAATSATLNNDASVLLLTPLVILLVRRAYPGRPDLLVPFAFAVFMAAGVAPLPVSNPINLIVADYAGIPFNQYTATMLPLSVAGWAVTLLVLRLVFLDRLASAVPMAPPGSGRADLGRSQRAFLGLLVVTLAAYPGVTALGGPVWLVAGTGAIAALGLAWRYAGAPPQRVLAADVSWGTLAFLAAVLLVAIGLRNAGVVEALADVYEDASVYAIGGLAALLSALLNNHPTAFVNMLAIERAGGTQADYFAALIGGDLGPRLLPTGSLAGLLWLAALRRHGVQVRPRQFIAIGVVVTAPTLLVSLLLLSLR